MVIARTSARAFSDLAEVNPRLWRNIARELAERLRQRNRFVSPVNPRPVLFLGSSTEALPIARAIQSALTHDPIVVKVWTDGIFGPSDFPIESLERELPKVDSAALVLSPDDTVVSRSAARDAPRDNIVFELGFFMGALGRARTFLIHPHGADIKIPTDLAGLIPLTYRPYQESEVAAALGPTCHQLRDKILAAGPR